MDAKSFFYSFGRAIYHIDAIYDDFAWKSGVGSPTLLWILYALGDGKAHTQREICLDWQLPKSTVNTVITELRHSGFVMLVPIKGKRREMEIILTESGRKYAESVLAKIYEAERRVFAELNDEQRQAAAILEKIAVLLKQNKEEIQ